MYDQVKIVASLSFHLKLTECQIQIQCHGERERVPQGSTLGSHNVPWWIGSVKLVGHNWDSYQNLSQWVFCSFKGNRHMTIRISRQWLGKAGQGMRKKGVDESGALEEVGWGKGGKYWGIFGRRENGPKVWVHVYLPDRFWSNSDILIKTCQHKCKRCDTKTQYITTLFTKLSPRQYIHESKSQPYQIISIIHDTFVSDTWWATERRRNHHNIHVTQQQTQCTSNTHSHTLKHCYHGNRMESTNVLAVIVGTVEPRPLAGNPKFEQMKKNNPSLW